MNSGHLDGGSMVRTAGSAGRSPAGGTRLRWPGFESVLLALIGLAVLWFDIWTVRSNGDRWRFGEEQTDYYNQLIHGWLDGQLAMKAEVSPALAQLADPYDPLKRPAGVALHDASFYHGKYYLYFGVTPAVVVMLPFRLVTGIDLPLPVAEIVFVYLGFVAAVATWLAVRRRYFGETGAATSVLVTAALGIASLGPMLLRRPRVWELPIAAGYAFGLLAVLGVWLALHGRRRATWLAVAATAVGFAIAARPTYLFATPMLLVPLVAWWRAERRFSWRDVAAALAPLAVIGTLLAWHNYARFGNPLEFGQKYQLSLDYESKMAHFSPRYAAFNFRAYFLSPAEWSRYFPFVRPAALPPKPAGMGGNDDVYGVLANLPLAWLALAAPLALRRRKPSDRAALGAWLGATAVLFTTVALVVISFFGTIARYELDFTPALILLAGIGVLAIEREVCGWRAPAARWLARAAVVVLAMFSVGFGVVVAIQLNGFFAERNQAAYRATARVLNRVPAAFERVLGISPVAYELELRLPVRPAGTEETLLSVGDPPNVDRVFLRYVDSTHTQLGFARDAMPEVPSPVLEIGPSQTHRVGIVLGAFLPPDTHPWFHGLAADVARRASRMIRLTWDGGPPLVAYRRFDHTAGARVRLGSASLGEARRPRFTGEVTAIHRVPMIRGDKAFLADSQSHFPSGDTFRLQLSLPPVRRGAREPLVVTGATGQGDLLGIEYLDATHVRFLYDHWGSALLTSDPIAVDYAASHEIVITMPGLEPTTSNRIERLGVLVVRLDGDVVWSQKTMGFRADPEEIALLVNPIGGSNCGAWFSGVAK